MAPLSISISNFIGSSSLYSGDSVDSRFIISVKTDNFGSSGQNQFTIPTIGGGYDYSIRTSDGQNITGLSGDTTITFPSPGTYDVFIRGSFPRMYFNGTGDRRKLVDIKNFGIYGLGSISQNGAFRGCSELIISAEDIGHFENVTDFTLAWDNCKSLTSFPLIDTSSAQVLAFTWNDCALISTFPSINTSNVTTFQGAWALCTSLVSFPLIDTATGVNFSTTWRNCSSLENFPSNYFDSTLAAAFLGCFDNTNLTTQSIDDILVSLDTSGVVDGRFTRSGGQLASLTGETAKSNLVDKGWTVEI